MDDDDDHKLPQTTEETRQKMISSFSTEITSSSRQIATDILEAHQWDIAAAVSAFKDAVDAASAPAARPDIPNPTRTQSLNPLRVGIPPASPPSPPIRLRSPRSPSRARNPFSRDAIQQDDDDDDFDDKENDDAMESDDVARDLPSSSSLPTRLILSDVTPQVITRTVTIWRNGFTIDDDDNNTLYSLDDPQCAQFLQGIESMNSPRVINSPDGSLRTVVKLIRRQQEDFREPPKPFQGVGRTLAEPDSVSTDPQASSDSLTTEPTPLIDPTAPTTSIQLVLADGRRINSRFNTHHTIRDVRDFIEAATPDDASRDYHLLVMGTFPPAPLTELDQTIEQAGISNSVLTVKF